MLEQVLDGYKNLVITFSYIFDKNKKKKQLNNVLFLNK
jgi:hypothetical protein